MDRDSRAPLSRQIFQAIKNQLLRGDIEGGTKLPSSRTLAEQLHVSRSVIISAYDQLLAEGYTETRPGSGTYTSEMGTLSGRGEVSSVPTGQVGFNRFETGLIDFKSGVPDLYHFPVHIWKQLYTRVIDAVTPLDLTYASPEGRYELREALAGYLKKQRGVVCHPDQIIITSGTTQAINIICALLVIDGQLPVCLEDPVTSDLRKIVQTYTGRIIPVPVDILGMETHKLPENTNPAAIYITPSHQYPLGVTMSASRRIELIRYTQKTGSYILEDDYDSEFCFDTAPLSTIHELAPDRVIYLGTFSKTLFPALRTAYIIFPPGLVNSARQAKWDTDIHTATLDQLVLARFISEGRYESHILKMKKRYRKKREILEEELKSRFGEGIILIGSRTGLHMCVRFPGVEFSEKTLADLRSAGVKVYPVENHAIAGGNYRDTVIMGYGILDLHQIREGVRRLSRFIESRL